MRFFHSVTTVEEAKKMYRKLAKQYHPDVNKGEDTTEIMKAINIEYEAVMGRFEQSKTETAAYKDMIDALIKHEGIDIEIIGTWVWVSGETFAIKDALKEMGFKWSKNKKAWYWHEGEYKARHKKNFSLDEIRMMHESKTVKTSGKKSHQALGSAI